jgi:hypothetical protein
LPAAGAVLVVIALASTAPLQQHARVQHAHAHAACSTFVSTLTSRRSLQCMRVDPLYCDLINEHAPVGRMATDACNQQSYQSHVAHRQQAAVKEQHDPQDREQQPKGRQAEPDFCGERGVLRLWRERRVRAEEEREEVDSMRRSGCATAAAVGALRTLRDPPSLFLAQR